MAQLPLKLLAFLAAYAPLWAIYAVRFIPVHWRASATFAILAVACPAVVIAYVHASSQNGHGDRYIPVSVARRDEATMAYLFSYVFPFVGLAFDDIVELASAGIFLLVLLTLYVRTNLLYVNPILSALGYKVYEIGLEQAPPRIILSKQRFLPIGQPIQAVRLLGDDVYVERGEKRP